MLIHHLPTEGKDKEHKYEWWTPIVSIANTDLRLMDWLTERFSGSVYRQDTKMITRKQSFMFRVLGQKLSPVLSASMPYLVLKRQQAELVIEYMNTHANVGRRGHDETTVAKRRSIAERLKEINRRGAPNFFDTDASSTMESEINSRLALYKSMSIDRSRPRVFVA